MTSENNKERKQAFIRFILFFVLTAAIASTALLFGFRLPITENNKHREELAKVESEKLFQEQFLNSLIQTQSLLDSVNKTPLSTGLLDGRVTQNIQSMDAMVNNSPIANKAFYQQIIRSLSFSQSDKTALRAASNKDSTVAKYVTEVNRLNNDLSRCKEAYDRLRYSTMP